MPDNNSKAPLKIDDSLLQQLGLGSLPQADKTSLLKTIYERLEMNVGMRLADQMTNEQLDEFEQYFNAQDDAGAFRWLETNFPNYKDIVAEEFEKLKAEVAQSVPHILAAAQQSQTAAPQPADYSQPQQTYGGGMPPAQGYAGPQQPGGQPSYQQPQPPYGPDMYQQPPQPGQGAS